MRFDPAALPAALANRVFGREAWAQACLAAHAGRVFAVVVGPLATSMRVDESGAIAAVRPGRPARPQADHFAPGGAIASGRTDALGRIRRGRRRSGARRHAEGARRNPAVVRRASPRRCPRPDRRPARRRRRSPAACATRLCRRARRRKCRELRARRSDLCRERRGVASIGEQIATTARGSTRSRCASTRWPRASRPHGQAAPASKRPP